MASLSKLLNLSLPVVQSPMAGISTVKMAAAVTNFGGLGSIPLGGLDVKKLTNLTDRLQEFNGLTGNYKVNVNFFCHEVETKVEDVQKHNWLELYSKLDVKSQDINFDSITPNTSFKLLEDDSQMFDEFIEILSRKTPSVVSFHFGLPKLVSIQKIQKTGSLVFVSVTSLQEAEEAFDLGIDGVVCQGYEAGGHRGNFLTGIDNDSKLSTENLFQQIIEKFKDRIVIPAGGIMDSFTIQSYLNRNAAAVQMGTIFLFCEEANSNPFIQTIDKSTTTMPTFLISGKVARCIKTKFIDDLIDNYKTHHLSREQLPPFDISYGAYKQFKAKKLEEYGFYLAGENWNQIPNCKNVEQVLAQLKD